MVRLTPQLIADAIERTSPIHERELILRGLKFTVIENLGIGLDAYDAYDLCDNDITKFDGFPVLTKAQIFYCNNNRIGYIAGDLNRKLPSLSELSLINNDLRSLSDIKRLEKCAHLHTLSLTRNPVSLAEHYRLFAIYNIPTLRFLDFNRVRDKERKEAIHLFEQTQAGKDLLKRITAQVREEQETILFDDVAALDAAEANEMADDSDDESSAKRNKENSTFSYDAAWGRESDVAKKMQKISEEQRAKIKSAILKATSIEEVERLNRMLQAGYIPE